MLSRFSSKSKRQITDSDKPKPQSEVNANDAQSQRETSKTAIAEEANSNQGNEAPALDSHYDKPIVASKTELLKQSGKESENVVEDATINAAEKKEPVERPLIAIQPRNSLGDVRSHNASVAGSHNNEIQSVHKDDNDAVERPLIAVQPRNSLGDVRPQDAVTADSVDVKEDASNKAEDDAVERPLIAVQPRNSLGDVRPHSAVTADPNNSKDDASRKAEDEIVERPLIAIQPRNSLGDIRPHNALAAKSDNQNELPEKTTGTASESPKNAGRAQDHPYTSQTDNADKVPSAGAHSAQHSEGKLSRNATDVQDNDTENLQRDSQTKDNSHSQDNQFISLAPAHHPSSITNPRIPHQAENTNAIITDSYKAFPQPPDAADEPSSPSESQPGSGLSMLERIAKKVDKILSHEERHFLKRKAKEEAKTLADASRAKDKEEEKHRHEEKKIDRGARKHEKEAARARKEEAKRKRREDGGISWGFDPFLHHDDDGSAQKHERGDISGDGGGVEVGGEQTGGKGYYARHASSREGSPERASEEIAKAPPGSSVPPSEQVG